MGSEGASAGSAEDGGWREAKKCHLAHVQMPNGDMARHFACERSAF